MSPTSNITPVVLPLANKLITPETAKNNAGQLYASKNYFAISNFYYYDANGGSVNNIGHLINMKDYLFWIAM